MESFQNQGMPAGSSPKKYESKIVRVTLYRQSGKADQPIETTFNEGGIVLYLIPNNQREDRIVAYQMGDGPVNYLDGKN